MYLEQTRSCMYTHKHAHTYNKYTHTHTNTHPQPTSWHWVLIVLGLRAKITLHQRQRDGVRSVFQQPTPFYHNKTTQSCHSHKIHCSCFLHVEIITHFLLYALWKTYYFFSFVQMLHLSYLQPISPSGSQ